MAAYSALGHFGRNDMAVPDGENGCLPLRP